MIKLLLIIATIVGLSIAIPMAFFGIVATTIAIKAFFEVFKEW